MDKLIVKPKIKKNMERKMKRIHPGTILKMEL